MKIEATSVNEYLDKISEERKVPFLKLRQTILDHLPKGFEEGLNYGMIGYYVPLSVYADGYHCDPSLPLPFINLGLQKKFIGLYHMGIYAMPELHSWFVAEYVDHAKYKLDMGKSCIRLKRTDDIP